jgi:hypothetical protein
MKEKRRWGWREELQTYLFDIRVFLAILPARNTAVKTHS